MSSNETPVSSVADWKKEKAGTVITLPSGKRVRLRAPGIHVFMKTGIIPDPLTPIVMKALAGGKEEDIDTSSLEKDPEKLQQLFKMYDDVAVFCFIEPKLYDLEKEEDRSSKRLYVDEIDFADKVFVFQFAVGGTADAELFRTEQAKRMASIPDGQNVQLPA